jgi:hypothetical protein
VAWAARALPSAATATIAEDARLLASLLASQPGGHVLQWLLVLHEDPAQLDAAAAGELDALSAVDVASPVALAALRAASSSLPAVEIARCAIALAAPSYRKAWPELVRPELAATLEALRGTLAAAVRWVPSLRAARVRLSHPLGRCGRAFPDRFLVGPTGGPPGASEGRSEVIAARLVHELAARVAGEVVDRVLSEATAEVRWAVSEDLALIAAGRRLAGSSLAAAHEAFVASLDRTALRPAARLWLDEVVGGLGDPLPAAAPSS